MGTSVGTRNKEKMVMEGKEKGCAVVQRSAKKGEKEDEYEKGKREGKERNAPSGKRGM